MALLDLWNSARNSIEEKHIQQIISFAGNGQLADNGDTAEEFRLYLAHIPSSLIIRYANECLTTSFNQGGFALQDITNEIGRRLSFEVIHGLYRGRKGQVGFDGIWKSSGYGDIVIEVKTSSNFPISLDNLANYRNQLIDNDYISALDSSILIVIGNEATGELEAQIRGSRHAWDIRLISVDALIKLMKLKETVEDAKIIERICAILKPQEFTRVDNIIDIVFSTAEDVTISTSSLELEEDEQIPDVLETPRANFHEQCIARISQFLDNPLTKQSRSTYISLSKGIALSCAVSKDYQRQGGPWFWFAFHPSQKDHIESAPSPFVAFGCGSADTIFLIPLANWVEWLPELNQSITDNSYYWHVQIRYSNRKWLLLRKGNNPPIDIGQYLI